jgi:hypothetical protein
MDREFQVRLLRDVDDALHVLSMYAVALLEMR